MPFREAEARVWIDFNRTCTSPAVRKGPSKFRKLEKHAKQRVAKVEKTSHAATEKFR